VQERTQHQQQHKANTIDKPTCTTEEGAGAVALLGGAYTQVLAEAMHFCPGYHPNVPH
jgi:hypothetical protein